MESIEVERRGKILGWVTRGGGSDGGVGVGVTLEVSSMWSISHILAYGGNGSSSMWPIVVAYFGVWRAWRYGVGVMLEVGSA